VADSTKIEASPALLDSRIMREPPTPLACAIALIIEAFDHAGTTEAFVDAANRAGLSIMVKPSNLVQFPGRRP